LLSNSSDEEINEYCKLSGFPKRQVIKKFVSHQEVPDYIGLGDFGITPFKPVPSKRYGTPIKTGEYMGMGLPIIITKEISDDSDTIKENNIGYVLKDLNPMEYKLAIDKMEELLTTNQNGKINKKISDICNKYRGFEIAVNVYKKIYS